MKKSSGFTLIETVIAITLLIILAIVIVPGARIKPVRVSLSGRRVLADLRYARNLSTTRNTACGIVFGPASYTLFENDDTSDPVVDPVNGGDFIVSMTEQFQDIVISYTGGIAGGVIKFSSLGEPMDNAGNKLGDEIITLTSGMESVQITIEGGTGHMSIRAVP